MSRIDVSSRLKRLTEDEQLPDNLEDRLDEIRRAAEALEESSTTGRLVAPPSVVEDREDSLALEVASSSQDYQTDDGDEAEAAETLAKLETVLETEESPAPDPDQNGGLHLPRGYEHVERIGLGGMGEVHAVRERALNRTTAMKIIRRDRADDASAVLRFATEAQITAQLDHYAIPPVYDFGRLGDDRLYFTVKVVGKWTFSEVIENVHDTFDGNLAAIQWRKWSLTSVLEAFNRLCEAVTYAHRCDVVHRDLKPKNVLVGRFGEIMLADWGLARLEDQPFEAEFDTQSDGGEQVDSNIAPTDTRAGAAMGTAPYMAPEQAEGDHERVGPHTDVFALGAMLYEVLTGQSAFRGSSVPETLMKLREGPDRDIREFDHVPDKLARICNKALSQDPDNRFAHAGRLRRQLEKWLEGRTERERAQQRIARADALREELEEYRRERDDLLASARNLLRDVTPSDPVHEKLPGWSMLEQAEQVRSQIASAESEYVANLQGALERAPDLSEAHRRLADFYRDKHERASSKNGGREALQWEAQLRRYDISGEHRDYLAGTGRLHLETEPTDLRVKLYRWTEDRRRFHEQFESHLGRTPVVEEHLDEGSYLLEIEGAGSGAVRYPVEI
ncbi:MAG: protein kinase, partial [Bradymonadaceae bacterium]